MRVRFVVPPVAVAVAAAVGVVIDARAAVAVTLLLLAVVGSSLLGRAAGVAASVLGAIALNVLFFDPVRAVGFTERDDVAALVGFVLVALVVGTIVNRANDDRDRAERREREARVRLDLTNRLLQGEDLHEVVGVAANQMLDLFTLASCELSSAGAHGSASSGRPVNRRFEITTDQAGLMVAEAVGHPLSSADEDVLRALVAGLGAVFVRADLERAARDARVESEVNRTRAAFFASAGHNLRTPLATVNAAVSALLDAGDLIDEAERRELLSTIKQESDRLTNMVSKILSQARIRSGNLAPLPEPVDLAGMIQAAVRSLGTAGSDHPLRVDVPAELGPFWLDVTMLEQILLNLLENAVRFAPYGTEVRVEAKRRDDAVELRVIDHGPGVPESQRQAVFEEFHRANPRQDSEGTGLGLAIVRALTELQGGSAWCEPTPGGGATFVARFPADLRSRRVLTTETGRGLP